MSIKKLREQLDQLEDDQKDLINSKRLQQILAAKREEHSEIATKDYLNVKDPAAEREYQNGFADGLQEAMNTVVGLLDVRKEVV